MVGYGEVRGEASDGLDPRLRSVVFEGPAVGIEWAGSGTRFVIGACGYLPPLYRNRVILV